MILIMTKIDSYEYELLNAYCFGKSFLWNIFFGWRKTIDRGISGEWAYFKISRKKYQVLKSQAKIMNEKFNF